MVFYFGRKISARATDVQLAEVRCERCHGEYAYELARSGAGTGDSPYGLTPTSASNKATRSAVKDLLVRMRSEAELVPCPHCQWISTELVQGYRRTCYRQWGTTALYLTIVGVATSWIAAWFVFQGGIDRWLLPHLLISLPATFLFLALLAMVVRSALRSLINPNRHYPVPPRIPPGTPPALLFNADEEMWEVVSLPQGNNVARYLDFQVGRQELPEVCCACLALADPTAGYECQLTGDLSISLPRCQACAKQGALRGWRYFGIAGVMALLSGLAIHFAWGWAGEIWVVSICTSLLILATAVFLATYQSRPGAVRMIDAARGIVRLRARHPDYARHPVVVAALGSAAGTDEDDDRAGISVRSQSSIG